MEIPYSQDKQKYTHTQAPSGAFLSFLTLLKQTIRIRLHFCCQSESCHMPLVSDLSEARKSRNKMGHVEGEILLQYPGPQWKRTCYTYAFWASYCKSLAWFKAIFGGISLLTTIWGDLGWGRFKLSRYVYICVPFTWFFMRSSPSIFPGRCPSCNICPIHISCIYIGK